MPLELKNEYYDGSGYDYMEGTSMACLMCQEWRLSVCHI